MKLALHSISYAGVWPGQVRLPVEEFLDKAAELGYDSVMLVAKRPHLSVVDITTEERTSIREQLAELKLTVSCLAGYTDFCMGTHHPEIPSREMQVLYVQQLCCLAQDLGCPLIRVFTGYPVHGQTHDAAWSQCADGLRECASRAADFGVTIGVQNHHDLAVHHDSLADLLEQIDHPHCKAMFDAWAPALQGCDLAAAVKRMAPWIVHTTVADYVRRPRYRYVSQLVNYAAETDSIRAVPMGTGFIDYRGFFAALKSAGYKGAVAYEMCSPLQGGGSEENLDRCAQTFLEYMRAL